MPALEGPLQPPPRLPLDYSDAEDDDDMQFAPDTNSVGGCGLTTLGMRTRTRIVACLHGAQVLNVYARRAIEQQQRKDGQLRGAADAPLQLEQPENTSPAGKSSVSAAIEHVNQVIESHTYIGHNYIPPSSAYQVIENAQAAIIDSEMDINAAAANVQAKWREQTTSPARQQQPVHIGSGSVAMGLGHALPDRSPPRQATQYRPAANGNYQPNAMGHLSLFRR